MDGFNPEPPRRGRCFALRKTTNCFSLQARASVARQIRATPRWCASVLIRRLTGGVLAPGLLVETWIESPVFPSYCAAPRLRLCQIEWC